MGENCRHLLEEADISDDICDVILQVNQKRVVYERLSVLTVFCLNWQCSYLIHNIVLWMFDVYLARICWKFCICFEKKLQFCGCFVLLIFKDSAPVWLIFAPIIQSRFNNIPKYSWWMFLNLNILFMFSWMFLNRWMFSWMSLKT